MTHQQANEADTGLVAAAGHTTPRASRNDRMPVLGWVAVGFLLLASALFLLRLVWVVYLINIFWQLAFWTALQEGALYLGGWLLPYGVLFLFMALGIAGRWQFAHAATVIVLPVAIPLAFLNPPRDAFGGPPILPNYGLILAFVAWILVLVTWRAFWRRRPVRSVTPARVVAAAGAAIATLLLAIVFTAPPTYPLTADDAARRFESRRSDFAEVVTLARGGAIDTSDYYGGPLPAHLADLSVDGKVATVGWCEGDILFLPQWIGIPDDAIGYVHVLCDEWEDEPPFPMDLYGDPASPAVELGDGWWWADGS